MACFRRLPEWHRSDVQPLEAVEVLEGKGEALPVVEGKEVIDVNRVNRLIAFFVATTVAKGLPASCEAG